MADGDGFLDRVHRAGNAIYNLPGNMYNQFNNAWDGEDVDLTPMSGSNQTYSGESVEGYDAEGVYQGNLSPVTIAYGNNQNEGRK